SSLWHCARLSRDFFATLEDDHRRNAANVEACGRALRVIGIELGDQRGALFVARELVDERRHHLTRAAPIRVEVDEHRDFGVRDGLREGLVVELEWAV